MSRSHWRQGNMDKRIQIISQLYSTDVPSRASATQMKDCIITTKNTCKVITNLIYASLKSGVYEEKWMR